MRASRLCLVLAFCLGVAVSAPEAKDASSEKSKTPIPIELRLDFVISGKVLSYELNDPAGIGIDAQGNVYISDAGNHRVVKFNREYIPQKEFGGYGGGVGRFNTPRDLIVDRGLMLYVLDQGNGRIVQLDAGLNYVNEIVPQDDENEILTTLTRYTGLRVSSLGEITVSDYDNSRLIRMDNFFQFSRYIGDFGYGKGSLLNPMSIGADKKENMYVADAGNARIAVYDDFGNYSGSIGGEELLTPTGVCAADNGTIWVTDEEKDSLFVYDKKSKLLARFGNPDARDQKYSDVSAVLVTRDNKLFIADSGNDRILIYSIIYEPAEK